MYNWARVTGLREIETLIGGADMPVALDRAGEPRRVPHVVDRGAYRVVRDALAGARKATGATVAIEYMPGALAVQVDHDGVGVGVGVELEEVADLAAALGGGLTAARAKGGFRVRAWLPTEGQPLYPAGLLAAR
jgi:signal transduction histidine kinase